MVETMENSENNDNFRNEDSSMLQSFDEFCYTLGFSTLTPRIPEKPVDLEVALVGMAELLSLRGAGLDRFFPLLFSWLKNFSHFLNAAKLSKLLMTRVKSKKDELPYALSLMMLYLKRTEPKRFGALKPRRAVAPFYREPRMAKLVEGVLQKEGLPDWLKEKDGYRLPRSAFEAKEMDLLSEKALFARNRQLALRLLLGPGHKADALWVLERKKDVTPSELVRETGMSYEPAHRNLRELRAYFETQPQT